MMCRIFNTLEREKPSVFMFGFPGPGIYQTAGEDPPSIPKTGMPSHVQILRAPRVCGCSGCRGVRVRIESRRHATAGVRADEYDHESHLDRVQVQGPGRPGLSLLHISEPTRQAEISYAVFCL